MKAQVTIKTRDLDTDAKEISTVEVEPALDPAAQLSQWPGWSRSTKPGDHFLLERLRDWPEFAKADFAALHGRL